MGKGQPWLTAGCPRIFPLAGLCSVFLVLVSALPNSSPSWLTTQAPPCPSACRCSRPLDAASTHLAVVCAQQGLTDLPPDLPASLTSLDLRGNRLTRLDHLPRISQMQFLDLSNNSLAALQSGLFENMTRLKTLDLSFNSIESLDDRVFENLGVIDKVDLSFNRLTSLSRDKLFGLDNVRVLNLTGNRISEVFNQTFLYLRHLKILDLSHNHLQYLPADAFQGLDSAQTILLQNNCLQDIMGAFSGLPQLTALDLSYNMLHTLETDTFANLPQLSDLQMSFNNISNISAAFLNHRAALKTLDLRGNSLQQIKGGTFGNFPSLQTLDLSQMPYLESISFNAFDSVISLTSLNLSCNPKLSFLPPQLLAKLPWLSVVDLRSNNFSVLSHITFHSNPALTHLYLAHNPFQCGCGVAWMLPQFNSANRSVVSDFDSVYCTLRSNGTAIPLSQVSQEITRCNNVTSINVTDVVSARIGSWLMLQCDFSPGKDNANVLTWTTPRGLVFHYYPYHQEATSHFIPAENQTGEPSTLHWWHSQRSYDPDIRYSPDHILLQDDGSLLIDFVLRSDAGPYSCQVHNPQHKARAQTTVLLDYSVLFEVKMMSLVVGMACAASFLALNTVYVVIMWGARKLVNKRRRERIHKLMENLDEYRTTQIARIRTNYSGQLNRIREHYNAQSLRLKENYTVQMKRVKQGCSNQVERIRDNYHARLNHLKDYSSHQIQQIRDGTNNQIIRIRDYGALQMERLRENYKLQQQHVLKVIEAMNLENCRNVVETECMRTESMIFEINFPDLDDDMSMEESSSQHSPPESVYATALNSDRSSQESLATLVQGQGQPVTQCDNATTIIVLPSDEPVDIQYSLTPSPIHSISSSALCDSEGELSDSEGEPSEPSDSEGEPSDSEGEPSDSEGEALHVSSGDNSERETVV